jgi:hypothetical protein
MKGGWRFSQSLLYDKKVSVRAAQDFAGFDFHTTGHFVKRVSFYALKWSSNSGQKS